MPGAAVTGRRARILVAEPLAEEGLALLRAAHEVDERVGIPREELLAILPDYDALLVRSQVQVDAEAIAAGSRLTRSSVAPASAWTTSSSTPPPRPASWSSTRPPATPSPRRSTPWRCCSRSPGASPPRTRRCDSGEWKRAQFTGHELRGKTLGVIGLGKIGMTVADRARGFEMEIIGHDPFVTEEAAALHGIRLASGRGDPAPPRMPSRSTCRSRPRPGA